MWKNVPVLFFLPKTTEKRLDKQAQKSTPPPPSVPQNDVNRILAVFLPCSSVARHISCIQILHFWGGKEQLGGGGGVSVCVGENFRPVCQVFYCFQGKTTQEHLFTSHRSACTVWVDSDILENFSRNDIYVIVAQSHSIMFHRIVHKSKFLYLMTSEVIPLSLI